MILRTHFSLQTTLECLLNRICVNPPCRLCVCVCACKKCSMPCDYWMTKTTTIQNPIVRVMQAGNLFHQLLMASHRQAMIKNQHREAGLVTDLDSPSKFSCSNCVIEEGSRNSELVDMFTDVSEVYEIQGASTCSSESAANSFEIQFHPLVDTVRLSSSDPSLLLDDPSSPPKT